jgi:hypothetical protein
MQWLKKIYLARWCVLPAFKWSHDQEWEWVQRNNPFLLKRIVKSMVTLKKSGGPKGVAQI